MAFGIKVFLLAALATLLVSGMPISAGYSVVGVEAGDWVKYGEISVTCWSSPPWPAEQYLVDLNNTEWIMVEVQSVLETNVTAMKTRHLENGTEKTETLTWNITNFTWGVLWGRLNFFIIEANLSKGDPISVVSSLSLTGTVSRKYAGATREVNQMNTTFLLDHRPLVYVDVYWDKTTGILCELHEVRIVVWPDEEMGATTTMKMIETNLWQPTPIWTEPWFWVITAVIVAAVAGPAIWVWRRRKMPPPKEGAVSAPT